MGRGAHNVRFLLTYSVELFESEGYRMGARRIKAPNAEEFQKIDRE